MNNFSVEVEKTDLCNSNFIFQYKNINVKYLYKYFCFVFCKYLLIEM